MSQNKTFHPDREFDDRLATLVGLMTQNGWSVLGLDAAIMTADLVAQRTGRETLDAQRVQLAHDEQVFAVSQEERHERFMTVVSALRSAFKNNKAILAQLEHLKRPFSKGATAPDATSTEPAPSPATPDAPPGTPGP